MSDWFISFFGKKGVVTCIINIDMLWYGIWGFYLKVHWICIMMSCVKIWLNTVNECGVNGYDEDDSPKHRTQMVQENVNVLPSDIIIFKLL